MSFWCYLLRCADGSYYAGHTDNLEHRIGQHQQGGIDGYTAKRLPVELAWSQEFVTREEALAAEQQVKGWSRKKKEGGDDSRGMAGGVQIGEEGFFEEGSEMSVVRYGAAHLLTTNGFLHPFALSSAKRVSKGRPVHASIRRRCRLLSTNGTGYIAGQ